MKIHSYKDETTGGADPTQLETWHCTTAKGTPFTVTQFFGDYMVQYPNAKEVAPKWMVKACEAHAAKVQEAENEMYEQDPCAGGWYS